MSNLAYKELIDSVGEQLFTNLDDIVAKGGKVITSSNGTQLGVFNGGKALNFTSGSTASLSNASGVSALTNKSIVSTVTSNTSAGIATKALGVASWVGKALMAFGVGYSGGIALGEALNETEWGRKFLIDYYNFFTGQDNAVDDDVVGFINADGTFYADAKSINNAFDYLHNQGVFDVGYTPDYNEGVVNQSQFIKLNQRTDLVKSALEKFNSITNNLYSREANALISQLISKSYFTTIPNSLLNQNETDYAYYYITISLNETGGTPPEKYVSIKFEMFLDVVFSENLPIIYFDNNDNMYKTNVTTNNSYYQYVSSMYIGGELTNPNITYNKNDDKKYIRTKESLANNISDNFVSLCSMGNFSEGKEGITILPNAQIPNKTGTLAERYPNWWSNRIDITSPDGQVTSYVPLTLPNTDVLEDLQIIPQANAQEGLITNENEDLVVESTSIATESAIAEDVSIPTNNPTEDKGNTPVIVPPVGVNRTGFINIYMPTKEDLQNFNNELWSVNPIDAIGRLFQNPMDAIIGLHQIYAPAPLVSKENIKVGLLVSKVITSLCEEQYVSLDFGNMTINEYFGNVLDYSPYTTITLYLPFIGFVELKTEDVMKSIINLKYNIDLLTGSCVAVVNVKRDNMNADLYTFNGNCAIQLPITGANYSGILSTILSAGLAIATKGATASLGALGVMSSVAHGVNIPIIHGNNATSNYGAMSGKTPFIIINRQSDVSAYNFNKFYGYASSTTIKLSKLSGYTKVKDVHVDNINNATDDELNMIYDSLTGGIII